MTEDLSRSVDAVYDKPQNYKAVKSDCGVWMSSEERRCESVSRMIAIDVMVAMGMDPCDFQTRDRIIMGISERVDGTLDSISNPLNKETNE